MDSLNLQTAMAVIEQSINSASPVDRPLIAGELERLRMMNWTGMMNGPRVNEPSPAPGQQSDRYLTVEEVTARFPVTAKWLYRHKKKLPHSQPSRKVLLFPEAAITKWFAARKAS